ncbi:MAG TPA: NAD(P)-dependent alcohol dehydrogenase [Acidimicrobiales bacterium]|jgi:propanol-preferring alcohol dehydrogenase
MRALRLLEWKSDPVLVEVEEPVPGPGQAVVRVGGAGACHSDLHLMRDFGGEGGMPWGPPFTLGHENAGWVHALGEGVTDVEVGQPVAVYGSWGCGRCSRCQVGIETYCENPLAAPVVGGGCGLGLDGGMAEFMLVPSSRHLVALPDGLDPVVAAPLTDAGLTPYHAIRRSWPKLGPTSVAAVIGVGGLGHLAVQIIKATTAARVIAIDIRQSALDLADRVGADACVMAGESAAVTVRAETGGWGADAVFDFVGSDATLQLGASVTRMMGDLTIVGIAGGTLPVSFFTTPYEVSIQTTYWGTRPELAEVLELGARGLVRPVIKKVNLDDALAAYKEMEEGTSEGRAVVVPNAG